MSECAQRSFPVRRQGEGQESIGERSRRIKPESSKGRWLPASCRESEKLQEPTRFHRELRACLLFETLQQWIPSNLIYLSSSQETIRDQDTREIFLSRELSSTGGHRWCANEKFFHTLKKKVKSGKKKTLSLAPLPSQETECRKEKWNSET